MSYDVRCVDLGKRYRLRHTSRPWPGGRRGRPSEEDFWALRHATFDVVPGEALGVIGPNGAGKSTLLKLLSSITAPSEGEIRIRGRIAALIEVGSGFHPELTGRENVFLSGTILGMRRRDIARHLDSIVDFAGVGKFLDVPVKWYSSGMYVRLGFAVAAHLEADVLLVDEVLAVGDAEFQARCIRRIHELRDRGTTIIFISHDLGTVERMCRRAILLRRGAVVADGDARDVVTQYQRSVAPDPLAVESSTPDSSRAVAIRGLRVLDRDGLERGAARTGEAITLELGLEASEPATGIVAEVKIYSFEEGVLLFECRVPEQGLHLSPGGHALRFDIESLGLLPGMYTLGAIVRPAGAARATDWWFGRTTLHVDTGPAAAGQFHLPYRWSLDAPDSPTGSAAAGTVSRARNAASTR
jgi:ABC-type polysaccharide/polyol phosphate transport system ATPase subunit